VVVPVPHKETGGGWRHRPGESSDNDNELTNRLSLLLGGARFGLDKGGGSNQRLSFIPQPRYESLSKSYFLGHFLGYFFIDISFANITNASVALKITIYGHYGEAIST
jgi:hypothetical protein